MLKSENVIDFKKFKEHNLIMNKESYIEFLFRNLTVDDFNNLDSRIKFYCELFTKGYSLNFSTLDFGSNCYINRFAITVLELKRLIFRIPTTDKYIKSELSEEPIGNFLCNANTLSLEGFLLLPRIEAGVVYRHIYKTRCKQMQSVFKLGKLPKYIGHSRLDFFQLIDVGNMTDEEAILNHIDKYGAVTKENLVIFLEKDGEILALEKLEKEMKIIRVMGSQVYIRYISPEKRPNQFFNDIHFEDQRISGALNYVGQNQLIDTEARHFSEIMCTLMEIFKDLSIIVSVEVALAGPEIK